MIFFIPFSLFVPPLASPLKLFFTCASPTHYTPNGCKTMIDLALISSPENIISCETVPPLSNSDHLGILVVTEGQKRQPTVQNNPHRQIWQYARADFELASNILSNLDLASIMDTSDIHQSWKKWKEAFLNTMESCIPKSTLPKRHNLPWLSKSLIQSMKKRNLLYKRAHATNNPTIIAKYRSVRNSLVNKVKKAKSTYFRRLTTRNSKQFWKIVKRVSKKEITIPTLTGNNTSEITTTSAEKANMLNSFFSRCFNYVCPPLAAGTLPPPPTTECPSNILCSEEEVYEYLSKLDVSKASGPDGLLAKC